jgi:catechol 2,3-dioxygenase-like lactoylglutathione lyase family enzyme
MRPSSWIGSAMYDHVTLRLSDLVAGTALFATVLDQLEIEQTARTPSFSVWGNFALTEADEDHPIARRVHVAFIAPSPGHVDRFWQAGVDAGFADDGAAGPRRVYADDYYAAFLKDPAGNSFEAVYRDGERARGNIDHVAIRVADVEASTAFYSTIGDAAGLTLRRQSPDSAAFALGASDGSLLIFAGRPTESVHIAFSGTDDDIRRFHADATAAGYRSNGEPGERPGYHAGYYAAYVLDPDGNNIEVVDHHR